MKLITGIVANWVARTPGCRERLATRPLEGARWTQPSRSNFALMQVGLGLGDLRSGLRFRRVGGEEFAFKISEVALRLLEVGPLPGPGRGECL